MTTFDELVGGGVAAIQGLLGRQETLQLEFKANDRRDPIFEDGVLNKAGKRILAQEASAFANSAGGVIVFGVDCRVVDKIDAAHELTPIASLSRAETSIRDAASELLQPRHDGIRVASVESEPGSDMGFIIVDVPRSDRRPHRSEASGQKQYFKRAGSNSFAMEHYDIEDAFRRASSPILELHASLRRSMSIGTSEAVYHLVLAIENIGTMTAKHISLELGERSGDVYTRSNSGAVVNIVSRLGEKWFIAAPFDFVVHPGQTREFHFFEFRAKRTDGVTCIAGKPVNENPIGFKYVLGAEHMRGTERYMDLHQLILEELAKLV